MRIEADFTRDDWRAYVRFYTQRARGHNRQAWLFLIVMAAAVSVCLWVFDRLFDRTIDPISTLIGIVLVYGIIFLLSRTNQAAKAIPESWLGRHVYELLPDALHTQGSAGTAQYPWTSIREVCEDPAYIYLLLDNVLTIVLPKRCMEPQGGAGAVKAEIERLRAAPAASVDETTRIAGAEGAVSSEPASGAEVAKPKESPAGWAFVRNLVAGLRLSMFLPVRAEDFRPAARQVALFILLSLGAWLGVERLLAQGEVYIGWYAVTEMGWLVAIAVLSVLLLTPGRYSPGTTARLLTALASAAPFVLVVAMLALALPLEHPFRLALELALVLYVLLVMVRAQRVSIKETKSLAIAKGIVSIVAVCFVFDTTVWERPEPWYSDNQTDESLEQWQASERVLFAQPDLIDAAVERLSAGTAGKTEVYFVGFAGYGEQGVFEKEIRFADGAFGKRIDLEGRSLQLVNSPDRNGETMPLATASGLTRSLAGIARRMNVDEDVLLLFLTSHGSEDAELSVSQGYLPLDELDGKTLRTALDDSGIRWRVIVISACHAGSFIPKLSDERTLIIAAAHADKSSFGCSDERELTYFGEAFLRDALPASSDLLDAFARARELVTARETEEGQEPSDPQLFVGAQMKAKLAELPLRVDAAAARAANAGHPPAAVRP
ncbi:MAG TPA: C13 family peptidase [Steroidobacteraceae bacterium]|nr:C13 family peptidase [Steroidobacteraceae bacterium]